jgi:uncharacterized membrane protein
MTAAPMTRAAPAAPRWRLSGAWRKTVLLTHILAAGVWIGLDVTMAILMFTAAGTDSPGTRGYALQALQLVTVWPMFTAAAVSLVTGVVLGLGSKYGLVRYWWVLVKLVLNLVLMTLVVLALRGGIEHLADVGRDLSAGESRAFALGDMAFPPIVSPTALLVAFTLSVFKPWGRTRKASPPGGP